MVPFRVGVSLERLYTGRLGFFSSYSTFFRVLVKVASVLRYYPVLRSPSVYSSKVPVVSAALIIARTFSFVSFFSSSDQLSLFLFPLPLPLYSNASNKGRFARSIILQFRTSSLSLGFRKLYTAFLLLMANRAKRLPLAGILSSPYRVTDLCFLYTSISTYTRLISANYRSLVRQYKTGTPSFIKFTSGTVTFSYSVLSYFLPFLSISLRTFPQASALVNRITAN